MAQGGAVCFEFLFDVALSTERPLRYLHEARVGQLDLTRVTPKALRMPIEADGLYDATTYELLAFAAHGRVQQLKVVFAKFPILKLVVEAVLKRLKALSASIYRDIDRENNEEYELFYFAISTKLTQNNPCDTFVLWH